MQQDAVSAPVPSVDRPLTAQAFVISMTGAVERRLFMAEQLDKTDLSWSFFDAHTSKIDDMPVHEDKFRRLNGRRLNKAEIGCYASHLHLIREHAINPRSEIMIVLEDDAIIDTDYFKNSENFLRIVERFGYVRLNAQMAAPSSEVFIEGRRRLVRFRKKVHGTLGYAVTREAARKFASHLVEMRRPVDIEMDRFWDHGIPILCLYQPVAIESSKSTQLDIRAFDITGLDWLIWKINNQVEKIRCARCNLLYDLRILRV